MMKEKILQVIKTSERPLTVNDIKKELQFRAVKEAYGVSTFTISDVRSAMKELIIEGEVEQKEIERKFSVYEKKEEMELKKELEKWF